MIDLDPHTNRTYHYWHSFVPDIRAGQIYGYRVAGPFDPSQGMRFDPDKLLLDPYAREVSQDVANTNSGGNGTPPTPAQRLSAWYSPDQVGMGAEIPVLPGKILEVLIEKDFRCIDDQGSEDQSDTFENPLAASLSC